MRLGRHIFHADGGMKWWICLCKCGQCDYWLDIIPPLKKWVLMNEGVNHTTRAGWWTSGIGNWCSTNSTFGYVWSCRGVDRRCGIPGQVTIITHIWCTGATEIDAETRVNSWSPNVPCILMCGYESRICDIVLAGRDVQGSCKFMQFVRERGLRVVFIGIPIQISRLNNMCVLRSKVDERELMFCAR